MEERTNLELTLPLELVEQVQARAREAGRSFDGTTRA